jgi:hypothetical protein
MPGTRCRCIISPCLIVVWLCLFHPVAYAVNYGENLLVNGNADGCPASDSTCQPGTGGAVARIPGWTPADGAATVVSYTAGGGFPDSSTPGPPDRMNAFFAGGKVSGSSSLAQDIDVSENASDIDGGKVVSDIRAWLGGFMSDPDAAQLIVTFFRKDGDDFTVISSAPTLGPVSVGDRKSTTQFLLRLETVPVPVGTRLIEVVLLLKHDTANGGGAYDDAYADSLSVILRKPMTVTSTADTDTAGTLRYVLPRSNDITFDPALFGASGAPQVISLATALADILGDTTITGPGADLLSIEQDASASAGFSLLRSANFTQSSNVSRSTGPNIKILGLSLAKAKGGAILNNNGTMGLTQCVISGNSNSSYYGGGIFNLGSLTLDRCTISGNTSAFGGAGIASLGPLSLLNCSIDHNSVTSGALDGGGILQVTAPVSIVSSTISNNDAYDGGGIYLLSDTATVTIINSTFSDNTASDKGSAIGLLGSNLSLDSCTFFQNNGAITLQNDSTSPATILVKNSIFSRSGTYDFLVGSGSTVTSGGFNLTSDSSDTYLNKTGDQHVRDAMLGPLQDNGGLTPTHALLPGSLAIDHGNTALTTDQRGLPRPVDDPNTVGGNGNQSDAGAFEVQLPTPTPTPTTPTPTPTPTPGILNNISSRLQVGTGENVLFAGFTIQGTGSKKVFIRAAGPSLASVGVAGVLANPQLELHNSDRDIIATNDDWQTTQIGGVITADQSADIQSSGFAPVDPAESAIIATLAPGAYTAIVQGVGGGTGVGTVEVYDLSQNNGANLTNISTRGFVQLGDSVLIGGFTVANQPVNVIVEAAGPSLRSIGVGNAMDDPQLELHDANGTIALNDDWQTTQIGGVITGDQSGMIQQSGLAPFNPAESALIARLSPGAYTAIMHGANNTSGVGVIALYILP